MVTEIREAGYETLRDFLVSASTTPSQWDYIELRDDSDNPVTRVSVTGDSRASWIHADGDQVLIVEIVVTGADADIPLSTFFTGSAMYNIDTGGNELSYDGFPQALIETEDDELTIEHRIELPQV